MSWSFTCECGSEIDGATREELVTAVHAHVDATHPMVTPPSGKDVVAIAEHIDRGTPKQGWDRHARTS